MKMEILSSSRRWVDNAKKLTDIVADELDHTAQEVGRIYYGLAKGGSPVDQDGDEPGRLKAGWRYRVKRLGRHGRLAELRNDVPYLPYVEYGHRLVVKGKCVGFVKGQFFVKKARVKTTRKELPKAYRAMDGRIKGRMGLD